MALSANLQFGDNFVHRYTKEYRVVDSFTRFSRKYNHSRPETDAQCKEIELTLIAPDMTDLNLYDWYINQGEQSCRLLFYYSDIQNGENELVKEVLLENAICYGISEEYSAEHHTRRLLKLQIVAEEVSVCDLSFRTSELW